MVRSVLPAEVSLTGKIFPEAAPLTLDSVSREIVWRVGDVGSGSGAFESAPSVAFQVALTPSISQRGGVAQIMGEAQVQGDDVFTEQALSAKDAGLDTNLPDDASAQGKGVVR